MKKSNDNAKLFGALILGAAIGGALGILFAPDKGSETMKKLAAKGDDLAENIKEQLGDILEDVKKEVKSLKEKANGFVENGVAKVEKFKGN
ncbi:MAG: YtxH domain-containing protein [Bacteroidetes bacterium]|nr:YtxH domain-containing protein [Bacteroidota bacterium]HET6245087.1 YtxH domain-containing protein [Bacteroidia bacterium]